MADVPKPLEVEQIPVPGLHEEPVPLKVEQIPKEALPQPSVAPNTTLQEDITTAGQRRINLIWEYTQAALALIVIPTAVAAATMAMFEGKEMSAFLSFLAGNVIGFYFSRTNHAAIGGVGLKATDFQNFVGR